MVTMAIVNPDPVPLARRFRYGSFLERYPDYLSWLDGNIHEIPRPFVGKDLDRFRSLLRMRCQYRLLNLSVRTVRRDDGFFLQIRTW
jgi:hypothetical protein